VENEVISAMNTELHNLDSLSNVALATIVRDAAWAYVGYSTSDSYDADFLQYLVGTFVSDLNPDQRREALLDVCDPATFANAAMRLRSEFGLEVA
jgi:hypothetical protein